MPKVSSDYEQAQKQRIIEGAARVFAEFGYRQTTMDELCKRLELSKGAVYIYFKSKEELFISTMDHIYQERYSLLIRAFTESDSLQEKFTKIFSSLGGLVNSDDNYAYTRLSVEGFLESDRIHGLKSIKNDSYNRFYKLLYELLSEGQATNQINPQVDISNLVVIMMATVDGLMMHSLVQGRNINPEKIQRMILDLFSNLMDFGV